MNNVNRTLYIPLYGKYYVSKRGMILHDPKAEEIWTAEAFPLKGKSKSKWLAFYMSMRAAVFDRWCTEKMNSNQDAVVLHLGCGMDSRALRIGTGEHLWYDVDFPDVINERRKYFQESETYKMIGADVRHLDRPVGISGKSVIVVMEGISMYMKREELQLMLTQLVAQFKNVVLLMDCYTEFAAKASRYKNPINDVGVTEVFGMDDPKLLENSGLTFLQERTMTPDDMIDELQGMERAIFKKLYAGAIAQKMYRLYEYQKA